MIAVPLGPRRRVIRAALAVALLLAAAAFPLAASDDALLAARWDQASAAAAAGDFADALAAYRDLERTLAPRDLAPALWYNLGTTLARLDRRAEAAHYLRLALAARPGDRDAARNLAQLGLAREPAPLPGDHLALLRRALEPAVGALPATAWALVAMLAWIAALASVVQTRRRAGRRWSPRTAALLVLAVALSLPTSWGAATRGRWTTASVMRAVEARSGPGPSFPALYAFEQGAVVWLDPRAPAAGHERVRLPDGGSAFIPADALRVVAPGSGR